MVGARIGIVNVTMIDSAVVFTTIVTAAIGLFMEQVEDQ